MLTLTLLQSINFSKTQFCLSKLAKISTVTILKRTVYIWSTVNIDKCATLPEQHPLWDFLLLGLDDPKQHRQHESSSSRVEPGEASKPFSAENKLEKIGKLGLTEPENPTQSFRVHQILVLKCFLQVDVISTKMKYAGTN